MRARSSQAARRAARLAGLPLGALAVLAVLCVAVLGGLVLAGLRPATERSGSMAPELRRGDLIFSRAVAAREVRVGDVVTFPDPYARGVLLTHRVRAERSLAGGRIAFTTRGDANSGSEHWTVAASGTLTRVAFSVPRLGLPILLLGAHPAYLALGAALALWLLALTLIWARGEGVSAPARRRPRWALAFALCLAALPATAAVASVAAPREEAPSVHLGVNDGGLPLFELEQMRPGEQAIACERVDNEGPSDARVGIWGQAGGTGLARWLTLTLQRGALPASAGAGSCEGFVADTADFEGLGPGVLYRGPLDGFPASEASAIGDPGGVWPATTAVAYRVTVSLQDVNAAQGLSAVQRFLFGARPADAPPGGAEPGGPQRRPAKPALPRGCGIRARSPRSRGCARHGRAFDPRPLRAGGRGGVAAAQRVCLGRGPPNGLGVPGA